MLSLGGFAFAAPWILLGFAALPILWFVLRVTPPAPRRIRFPALRLLIGLAPREETAAKTPLWLILLRMALAALIILALAHPLLHPSAALPGSGPVVIAVDNGWGAAPRWSERQAILTTLAEQAAREDRRIVLLPTAPPPGNATPPALSEMRPEDASAAIDALRPRPWPVDRKGALARLADMRLDNAALVWLSDGIDDGDANDFAAALNKIGSLRVLLDPPNALARLIAPPEEDSADLAVSVRRADTASEDRFFVRAIAQDGRLLGRAEAVLKPGQNRAIVPLPMPVELRNRAFETVIEGESSAGATLLLDERWRRRPVGITAPPHGAAAQPLLSGAFYLERALQPFTEVRRGDISQLLQGGLAVLLLPDGTPIDTADHAAIVKWLEDGGMVLRFAGPALAEQPDDLLPVTLRQGGRSLGGALSWESPAHLAPFPEDSPFAGLAIPGEVTVNRQVLAEPEIDLSSKIWARLTDGTPLVTAEKRGHGWLVLVHTTADPEWSSLPLSGLFVEMLRRLVGLSQGIAAASDAALPPVETLDGFGQLDRAPASAETIQAGSFADTKVSAAHPPGFYGSEDARRALNLAGAVAAFGPIKDLPESAEVAPYAGAREIDFRPWLLGMTLALALADLLIAYALRGLFGAIKRKRRGIIVSGMAIFISAALGAGPSARAASADDFAIRATSEFHLAYVRTGITEVDNEARAGLAGLSRMLNERTAVAAAEPMEVNLETDELIFFPLLYWPVAEGEKQPSAHAIAKINRYLATGGTILFDTRDQGTQTPLSAAATAERLRRLVAGLAIPPLEPLPPDHVLTRSYYLTQDFPGRWVGGRVWIEPTEGKVNDGVASVIAGGNDWAGAWAMDETGQPLYAAVPGGEPQREMAYRFGINLVMYTLTGNYKTDQVHVPAILERLGQ